MTETQGLKHGDLIITSSSLTSLADGLEHIIKRIKGNDYVAQTEDMLGLSVILANLQGRFFGP